MIRVIIQGVPVGVEALAHELDRVNIGCKFPLNNDNQDLFVMRGRDLAEIEGYNMSACYDPAAGNTGWIDLAIRALEELRDHGKPRAGGEIYPGMLAWTPAEFDAIMLELTQNYPVDSVRLFGRRALEDITMEKFLHGFTEIMETKNLLDGRFILANWPAYIPYYLEIRLSPAVYRDGRGAEIEREIMRRYAFRPFPQAPDMICMSGLMIYFHRPDGNYSHYDQYGKNITTELGEEKELRPRAPFYVDGKAVTFRTVKAWAKAGNLLYNRHEPTARRLHKYPGKSY